MICVLRRSVGAIAFASAVALGQYAHAALYAYWPLNEGAGSTTATFGVGGLGAGTVNNTATGGLGAGGNAWVLGDPTRGTVISGTGDDGSGAFAIGGNIPSAVYNANFTITGWVALQATNSGGNDVVLGNRFGDPGGSWAKLTPNNYEWSPGGGGVNINDIPLNATWHQHTIVKNGTNIQYYVDGVPTNSGTGTGGFGAGPVPFYIGGDPGGERPRGLYDEVGFFNQALSDGKARAMYGLSSTTQLKYDLLEIQQIYDAYDASANVTVDTQVWVAATSAQLSAAGVLGGLGQVVAGSGGRFGVLLDATAGTGMLAFALPEPASWATWSLMAAALVAVGVVIKRRRQA